VNPLWNKRVVQQTKYSSPVDSPSSGNASPHFRLGGSFPPEEERSPSLEVDGVSSPPLSPPRILFLGVRKFFLLLIEVDRIETSFAE